MAANKGLFIKGHLVTDEIREKMRQAKLGTSFHKGFKHSEETKKRISMNRKGKAIKQNNPAWKGGLRSADFIARRSFKRTMQKQIFERDDYTCQLCGIKGVDLQVDHIQSWAEYVELRFSMDNCRTLCAKCHYQITFGREMPKDVKSWGHNFSRRVNP